MTRTFLPLIATLLASICATTWAGDGNRLVHLDEPNNPWQFHRESAKLITPQWIGEAGVEAVLVLAIDDMVGTVRAFAIT